MKFVTTSAVTIGLVAAAVASPASAEWKPERPIEIIVGFAPGGGTDQTARLTSMVFMILIGAGEVKASGRMALAAETVAKAEPDGYTLLVAGGSESTSVPNHREISYSLDDFRGILRVNREHMVIVTKKGS